MSVFPTRTLGALLIFLVLHLPVAGKPREGLRGEVEHFDNATQWRDKHALAKREDFDNPSPVFQDDAPPDGAPPDNVPPPIGPLKDILLNETVLNETTIYLDDCQIVATDEHLGYDIETNNPVYHLACHGGCAKNNYTCQARFRYVTVRMYPAWLDVEIGVNGGLSVHPDQPASYYDYSYSSLRTVRLVATCACLPAPCLVNGGTVSVPHDTVAYNDCGERCRCRYGALTECCRIRKSVTHMPFAERKRYIDAHRDISSGVHGPALKNQYDTLIADHTANFFNGIHGMAWFLPWHRHYLLLFENLLRQVDCRITVPYWASELYYTNPWGSILWSGAPTWYGGGTNNQCVPDGAFTSPWTLTPSASNDCLRRRRINGVPSAMDWATLLATPAAAFANFASTLDTYHGSVHCAIHGTMCTTASANAPEFFLWHGQVDRYWDKWQSQSPAHASSYSVPVTQIMASGSIAGNQPISAFMNSASQGDGVCVVYQNPRFIIWDVIAALARLPKLTLLSTPASSTASLLARAREWMRTISSAADGGDRADVDADVLAELRGRPVSSLGAEYPLGADLNDIRESLNVLRSNSTENDQGQDTQGELLVMIDEALNALEEFELYGDQTCCEDNYYGGRACCELS